MQIQKQVNVKPKIKFHIMGRITTFLKKKDLYLGIVRYLLGLIMITYGLTKILRTQFVVIPFSLWQRPLETISGRSLAWAFLSYSPWFQVLLGFLEFIPAILLLFRRTAFLGAILLLPMTLNVFLINHALNLWDDTKMISLILLFFNIAVLLFEWKRVRAIFYSVIEKGKKFRFSAWEIAINVVAAAVVIYLFSGYLMEYVYETNALTGDWYNGHPNEWVLKSEKMGDSTLRPRVLKCYYGAFGEYSEFNDTGYVKRGIYNYTIDQKKHTLKFNASKKAPVINCTYRVVGDTALYLNKTIDSATHKIVNQVFKRRVMLIRDEK
jgi:hypothetical protein